MDNLTKDSNGLVKTGEFTSVNPQYASPQALTQAYNYNVGNVNNIDASNLTSQGLAFPSTPTPNTGSASALTATSMGRAEQMKNAYDLEVQKQQESAKQGANEVQTGFWNSMAKKSGIIQEKAVAEQTPEMKALKELDLKTSEDLANSQKAEAAEINAINNSTQFPDQKAQALAQVTYKYAFQNAQLSITADIANNRLKNAQDTIDKAAQLQLDMLQPEIDYYDKLMTINYGRLSAADTNTLQAKKDEYENLRQSNADNVKANGDAMVKYNSMGANITINDTAEQRASKIASVGGELGYDLYKDKMTNKGSKYEIKTVNGVDMLFDPSTGQVSSLNGDAMVENQKLDAIQKNNAIRSAVGPSWLGRFVGSGWDTQVTGQKQNFIGDVEQMISKEFLQNLIDVKAQGATFGALQKAEQDALTQSATKIGNWRITEGSGEDRKVVGYNASEKDFKAEIDKITGLAKKSYIVAGGSLEDVGAVAQDDGTIWIRNSSGSLTQIYP